MAVNLYKTAVRSYRSGILLRSLSSQSIKRNKASDGDSEKYEKPIIATITLDQELPDLPKATYIQKPKGLPEATKVTTLSNGLRVASEARFGQFCTVGVCIDSGKFLLSTYFDLGRSIKVPRHFKLLHFV